jgi:DNA-nicking Smr family endonuclease
MNRRGEGHNRVLDAEDAALWAHVAAQTRPLQRRAVEQQKPKTAEKKKPGVKPVPTFVPMVSLGMPPLPAPRAPTPVMRLARTDERKIKRGTVEIGGRIDLHGMTRDEAHRAVRRFLFAMADDGARMALVITGKGRSKEFGRNESNDGVLRGEFPRWLAEGTLARIVLAWRPAAPRHGGDGAFYVLLRRKGKA